MHIVRLSIVSFIFYFLLGLPSFAQTDKADSLLQIIEQTNGERKLELIQELIDVNYTYAEYQKSIEMLEEEASRQKNMKYLAISHTLHARLLINGKHLDSVIYYAELANTIYATNNIDNPNQTYMYSAFAYLRQGCYDLTIHNLNIYLEKNHDDPSAYEMLGQLYFLSKRLALAKENYLKAIELLKENEKIGAAGRIMIHRGFSIVLLYNKEYEAALEACSTMNDILNKNSDEFSESMRSTYLFLIYHLYADIYITKKDVEKGKFYLDKLLEMPKSSLNGLLEHLRIVTLSDYYLLLKDYNKSLNYLDEALAFFREESEYTDLRIELTENKIYILEKLGKYSDALMIQKEFMHYKDSIHNENVPLQISQLSKSYELNKIRTEQQKDRAQLERSQAIILGLIAAVSLLCVILYLVRRNAKTIKAKNEMLFKQHAEVDKYISLTRKRLISEKEEEVRTDKELSLFDKIEEYMIKEEAYKNPDLTREEIAGALNTNWLYIINAIKTETGKTFFDYVNEYRLNHARLELMEEEAIPVRSIIQNSGFSSNATFYRLFKQRFGMSPNEIRQIKAKLEQEVMQDDLFNES